MATTGGVTSIDSHRNGGRTDESLFPIGAWLVEMDGVLPACETTRKTVLDDINRTSFVSVKYVMGAAIASTIWRAEKKNYFCRATRKKWSAVGGESHTSAEGRTRPLDRPPRQQFCQASVGRFRPLSTDRDDMP